MKIDSSGLLVIDDKYICEFMVKNGNESFFAACESILKSICLACEHNLNNSSQSGVLLERFGILNEITLDLIEKSLTGNEEYRPQSKEFACDRCGHVCANKSGLTLHKKKCAS
jgi:hypothetical protein